MYLPLHQVLTQIHLSSDPRFGSWTALRPYQAPVVQQLALASSLWLVLLQTFFLHSSLECPAAALPSHSFPARLQQSPANEAQLYIVVLHEEPSPATSTLRSRAADHQRKSPRRDGLCQWMYPWRTVSQASLWLLVLVLLASHCLQLQRGLEVPRDVLRYCGHCPSVSFEGCPAHYLEHDDAPCRLAGHPHDMRSQPLGHAVCGSQTAPPRSQSHDQVRVSARHLSFSRDS